VYQLDVETDFSAAHQLRVYRGKCENLHGHNWRVRVTVAGDTLDAAGMLVDFAKLKRLLAESTSAYDHRFLNDVRPFSEVNPTSENLARILADDLALRLPAGIQVSAVTVWESERCSATYRPERLSASP